MKKNSIVVTHFCGDGGNFLINALSMSGHVGNHEFPSVEERKKHFFKSTEDNINKEFYYKDVILWSANFYSFGNNWGPEHTTLKEFYETKSSRLARFEGTKHYICRQHYPLWNLLNTNINPDKIHDVNIMLESTAKLFKDISTKTNCFNILFTNPSIFTALRHYFIDGFSLTCRYPFDQWGGAISYDNKNVDVYEELNDVTLEEYQEFPENKRKQIESRYSRSYDEVLSLFNKKYNNLDVYYDLFLNKTSFLWDVNWYLTEDDTANNVKKLYDILGFDDYDDDLIRDMYRGWIKSLSLPVSKWRKLDADPTVNLDKLAEHNKRWTGIL